MFYKSPLFIMTGIVILFLTALGIIAAYEPKPKFIIDKEIEDRVYSKCISNVRLDLPDERMLEWVDRCNKMAKSLSVTLCDK